MDLRLLRIVIFVGISLQKELVTGGNFLHPFGRTARHSALG